MENLDKLIIISIIGTIIIPIILLLVIKPTRDEIMSSFEELPLVLLEFLLYLIITFFISMVFTYPVLKLTSLKKNTYVETKKYNSEKNIKSLYLNNEPKTQQDINEELFSLGMSVLNTDSYFYFFVEENNKYKLEKVSASYTYVQETDDIDPKITIYEEKEVSITEVNPTVLGKILGLKQEIKEEIISVNTENNIYIPVGSIVEKYNPN